MRHQRPIPPLNPRRNINKVSAKTADNPHKGGGEAKRLGIASPPAAKGCSEVWCLGPGRKKTDTPELSLSAIVTRALWPWMLVLLGYSLGRIMGAPMGPAFASPSACVACCLREDLHALQLTQLRYGDRPISHLGLEFVQSIHDLLSAFYTGAPSLFLCLQIRQ